jgi:hypothetical protein
MKLNKKELTDWLDHLELEEKLKHFERHGVKLAHLIKDKVCEIVEEMKKDEKEDKKC